MSQRWSDCFMEQIITIVWHYNCHTKWQQFTIVQSLNLQRFDTVVTPSDKIKVTVLPYLLSGKLAQ